MSLLKSQPDGCFIVVKALPHRSSNYFETVCCAGVGRDLKWRRQYPVPYRLLQDSQKFSRWQWIDYEYVAPKDDPRSESQKVIPESIEIKNKVGPEERTNILNELIRPSLFDASQRKESLALIRPERINIRAFQKSDDLLKKETEEHRRLAQQGTFFSEPVRPFSPCPFKFRLSWNEFGQSTRHHTCDDWETSTAFFNFRRRYGEKEAIKKIAEKYEEYFSKGLALAFSTHSRRNQHFSSFDQWLLVGMIRLDRTSQGNLF
ncbi:MAG: hypothetical protein AAFQ22_01055 [Pseudomonadota bacterium]